jgi:hypothetical protein
MQKPSVIYLYGAAGSTAQGLLFYGFLNCVQDTFNPPVMSFCSYVVWLQEPEERTVTVLKLTEVLGLCRQVFEDIYSNKK